MLIVSDDLRVPLAELSFTFSRSSGPGGQNVNKVNSKATLRWNAVHSPSLTDGVRQRFMARFARRLTVEGDLLVTSQRFRDQGRNVADCLAKLREMLSAVAVAPKARKATKPSHGSKRRRLEDKRVTSQRKAGRQRPGWPD